MSSRREPIETGLTSSVVYPSGLFSLEKDEVYPYERFAYNVLDAGVYGLHLRGLPESISVDFTRVLPGCSPWSINASVSVNQDSDGRPLSFTLSTPEFAPAIFYMFAAIIISDFFDDDSFVAFKDDPRKLGERIQHFIDGASAGVRAYRDKGLAHAIRAGYEHLDLSILDLQNYADGFDLLTKQIAYHEVAHAYIRQFMRDQDTSSTQGRAFELIADLVATEWLYNVMVRNTPDTEEYREFRGLDTYADTILTNSLMSIRSQQAGLILSAISGAQRTKGPLSLTGSKSHPPALQRYQLQHIHLYTLIASNFSDVLPEENLALVGQDWSERMDMLVRSGVIPLHDLEDSLDLLHCDTIETAADLIEEHNVPELRRTVEYLRATRENLARVLQKRNR